MIFTNLTLIGWYKQHGRDLPWRCNTDAYTIWLSEIILQQTRVVQGLNYFNNFKKAYPTVHNLAQAPLDEVLKLWQGLGYYTRARNLHATAQIISQKYNGVFPQTYDELRKLKGIGDYTAAAIASIAYKIPVAVVDGNVMRVLSRLFGIFTPIDTSKGKKEIATLAQTLVDKANPDIYNQAIMDFGAMVCTPKKAQCCNCPFSSQCYANLHNCVYELPVKSKKTKIRTRYFNYLIIRFNNWTYVHQRKDKDIWHSLYEFPLIESETEISVEELIDSKEWKALFSNNPTEIHYVSDTVKHQLSHQTLFCRFYHVKIKKQPASLVSNYNKIKFDDVENFSTPRLIENYMIKDNVRNFFQQ